jgi:hypothetical protein
LETNMLQKTSSIAIAAALAVFTAQAAAAQDQNSTTTGQQIQPPAATDTTGTGTATGTDAGTMDTGGAAGTAQTTPPAGADTGAATGTAQTTEPSTTPDASTAQTPAPDTGTSTAETPAPDTGTSTAQTPATDTDTSTAAASGASQDFMTAQSADQFLGSDLMGAKVRSAANEDIGEVNDVLFDMQGQSVAIIVGVGGFLGIGEKNVAIPFERFTVGREEGDADDILISLETTKDELNAAPEFKTMDDNATATSSTEGVTPAPNDTGSTTGATDPAVPAVPADPSMSAPADGGTATPPATNQ